MRIDLRSDTVTKPSEEMRRVMWMAEVGDEAFKDDMSTIALEEYCAEFFGKEDAVFMPSGTMSNQIALRAHTKPGDEVILDRAYHIYFYESAPTADLAKITLNPITTQDGVLRVEDIAQLKSSKFRSPLYCEAKLISVENTISGHGGTVYPFDVLRELYEYAKQHDMRLHQDGARVANASVASGISTAKLGSVCDTVSMCFAKGLGAPFGSILAGDRETMTQVRMYRKWYGGGMHQSGIMAAAALYAIQHNIERMAEDHRNAKLLAELLADTPGLRIDLQQVQTNMVFIHIDELPADEHMFTAMAQEQGVLLYPQGSNLVRAVTHHDVSTQDIVTAAKTIHRIVTGMKQQRTEVLYA